MFDKLKNKISPEQPEAKVAGEEAQQQDKTQDPISKSIFQKAEDDLRQKYEETTEKAKGYKKQFDSAAAAALKPYKDRLNAYIKKKVEEGIITGIERMRPHAKAALKDKDMFECEKKIVDEIVDNNWPILVDDVKFRIQMMDQEPYVPIEKKQRFCLIRPIYWFRAKYLYATMPYNQTFFKQRKNPFFWFFLILSVFPYYGVQPCFYFFIFICIDKGEEYQLVKYILNFKKMQFITQGCMQGVIGYVQYFLCASNASKNELDEIATKCIDEGPGSNMNFLYDLAVYCMQILLIFWCYLLLPCSYPKGIPRFKYDTEHNAKRTLMDKEKRDSMCQVNCERGGMLQSLLIFDILSFGLATFLYIYTFKSQPVDLDWDDSTPYLFFGKFIYGILSFPYLLFSVPVIKNLLTKCQPTAYDQYGNTVPHNSKIDLSYKDKLNEEDFIYKPDVEEAFVEEDEEKNK